MKMLLTTEDVAPPRSLEDQVARLQRSLRQSNLSLHLMERSLDNLDLIYRSAITSLSEQTANLNQKNQELEEIRNTLLDANAELQQAREELLVKNAALEEASSTDALTGVLNRKKLNQLLEQEIKRSHRYSGSLSIILMDIDHFKQVNDRFGHLEGDRVLVKVVEAVGRQLRTTDMLGRWGGEEFLILCPSTPGKGALALAEKLRLAVEKECVLGETPLTASFGVAVYDKGDRLEALVRKADKALYRAKQTRNSTRLFPPQSHPSQNEEGQKASTA